MKLGPKLYLFILFFLIPYNGYSQSTDCNMEFFLPGKDFLALFDTNNTCKNETTEAGFCTCLQGDFKHNALKQALGDVSLNDWKIENYEKNTKNLYGIYANLNYETSFQETIFGMNKKGEGKVGCTPKDIAKEFRKSLCNEYKDCGVDEGGVSIGKVNQLPLKDCKDGNCTETYKEVNDHFKDQFKPYVIKVPKASADEKGNSKVFFVIPETELPVASQSAYKLCAKSNDSRAKDLNLKLTKNKISEIEKFYKKHPELLVSTSLEKLADIDMVCEVDLALQVIEEYDAKRKFTHDASKYGEYESFGEEMVEKNLLLSNEQIQEKIKAGYEKSLPNACIDYNKYKIFNSSPSPNLISQLSSKGPKDVLEALDPKNLKSSNEMVDFLRQNPIIAKNIVIKEQREKLATKMSEMFSKMKNQDENQRLKTYMDFMKNDVSQLNAENKVMDLLQCDLLAQNFAALNSIDEFPAVGLRNTDLSSLANQYMACKMREQKSSEKARPSMSELIAANDLFSLFNESPLTTDPGDDQGYQNFLKENCKGFEEFVKLDLKVSCFMSFNKKKCTENLMTTDHSKRVKLLNRYYKLNSKVGKLNQLIGENTVKLEVEDVFSKTDISQQDQSVRSQYNSTVRPKLKNRSIYSTDNVFNPASGSPDSSKEIVAALKEAQSEYYSSPSISNTNTSVANTQNSDFHSQATPKAMPNDSTNTVNPGQFIPPFLKPEPLSPAPKQLASPVDFLDAFENFSKYSDEAKEDIVDQSKEFLGANVSNGEKITELKKKITEYEKEIEEASVKKTTRGPASVPSSKQVSQFSTQNLVNNQKATSSASVSPATYSASHSFQASITSNTESKDAASYSKALNQAHDKRTIESFGMIVVKDDSAILFSNNPISKGEVAGDLLVSVPLEPDSFAFKSISTSEKAMKEYLLKNVSEVEVDKIVSIKCKGPGCNPNMSEILLHFSRGKDNEIIVRSVASDYKVARTHRMIDLSRTLDNETKIKQ
jgi:hypothetical protein